VLKGLPALSNDHLLSTPAHFFTVQPGVHNVNLTPGTDTVPTATPTSAMKPTTINVRPSETHRLATLRGLQQPVEGQLWLPCRALVASLVCSILL
jgi:hypothetical protein